MARRVPSTHRSGGIAAAPTTESPAATGHENTVVLTGKLAGRAEDRTLPSGDVLVTWRIVVRRPAAGRRVPEGVRAASVDTIDCASWRRDVRRALAGWSVGDVVRIEGSLRRRFWRTTTGPASRYEVEVTRVRRLSRAASS